MRVSCGSNREAACRSSARAINNTSVAENNEIRQTVNAFFNSMSTLLPLVLTSTP